MAAAAGCGLLLRRIRLPHELPVVGQPMTKSFLRVGARALERRPGAAAIEVKDPSGLIPAVVGSWPTMLLALALSTITTAGQPAKADSAQWDAMMAAAKKEGSVRVSLPNGLPNLGPELAKPFQKRFGIELNAANDNASIQMRVEQEANAGKLSVDVILSGAGELLGLYPEKLLAPVRPLLVEPETVDETKWRDGKIKWIDNAQQYMPMSSEWVHLDLVVNADFVKPSDITSWQDLLDPKYKGKIIALMPTLGAGGATARALLEDFGPDYLRDLYLGQSIKITRNASELVRTIATGSQPIGLALLPEHMEDFRKQGFNLVRVFPTDGKQSTSGGSANAKLVANAPHPNAAAVFINWFMSKDGQDLYAADSLEPSRRLDVKVEAIPDYIIPKSGIAYRDQYQENYYTKVAVEMRARIEQLLGR